MFASFIASAGLLFAAGVQDRAGVFDLLRRHDGLKEADPVFLAGPYADIGPGLSAPWLHVGIAKVQGLGAGCVFGAYDELLLVKIIA